MTEPTGCARCCVLSGTYCDRCDLLVGLIQYGFRVLEFRQRRAGLEEIFMNVTKGEVQ